MNLARAISIAAQGFENINDKGGHPYILHCIRVMQNLHTNDDELKSIAILHDTVEDKIFTLDQLREWGFSERVIRAIDVLSHKEGVPYEDYIELISNYPDCVAVKLADLKDNSDIARLTGLTKRDFKKLEKYNKAFVYLSKI